MQALLFEDPLVDRLDPLILARPAYTLSCGGFSLIDRVRQLELPVQCVMRTHLQDLETAHGINVLTDQKLDQPTLAVNARTVPSITNYRLLEKLKDESLPFVFRSAGRLLAAVLPAGTCFPTNSFEPHGLADLEKTIEQAGIPADETELTTLNDPHDLVRQHLATCNGNLSEYPRRGELSEIADGVFVGPDCRIDSSTRFDTTNGPIIVEAGVFIGPFVYLRGPIRLGAGCQISEQASIKDNVSIGPGCRIGGEVQESTIEEFTNKRHFGFLGHSYIGRWVNLGAGTSNSNLKNTYGEIRIETGSERVPTGMRFLGCMMGDYSRSAINTSIFTGKIVGVCSMLYGFITTNVPSFANYAKSFGQITELPVNVMIETQRRMFERRQIVQRPGDIRLLQDIHSLVRAKRQLADGPLSL